MAKCQFCEKEMTDPATISCDYPIILVMSKNGRVRECYYRNTTYFDANERCHDCEILNQPGCVHHAGCDIERCPKCGRQLISCGCFAGDSIYAAKSDSQYCKGKEIKQPVEVP